MIAALPMYDRPETAAAHDRLWARIRDALAAEGVAAPDTLHRGGDPWRIWEHPDLLLGQSCGLPYRARLHRRVTLLGAFDYGLDDTPPGHYRSVLLAGRDAPERLEAFAGGVLAYNDALSQSGWVAPQPAARAHGFRFTRYLATGAHAASVAAVAAGRADIAAIDAVSWRTIRAHDVAAADLGAVGRTAATPGLPLFTARPDLAPALRRALQAAAETLDTDSRATLGIRGFVAFSPRTYLALPIPPGPGELPGTGGDLPLRHP
ncbi:hypothetical protein DDZ14_12535 [Maritimibacter sp. 55A14]|uniref:PhnD/SsuA/transferrin family substrate-binding protein n=1 Tax=Maritimibacter sp. 55A14 TaxID=2174844 RepID=UPI000D618428|nr:PhnD/SsuA/transferrin family substrate-binding protein [Maritimibacter sp. 55A14]PWE32036.1 hypothetical protein DDZ14_12535 [Maritimibacter sp. 55A14]